MFSREAPSMKNMAYPNIQGVFNVSKRVRKGLIPPWIQAFINDFALIELFAVQFELHIRVTGT